MRRAKERSWGLQLAGYAICLMEEDFHKMLLKQNFSTFSIPYTMLVDKLFFHLINIQIIFQGLRIV
jgi:hypothetical protein